MLTRNTMMWGLYEIIHTWTAVVDESEEWSSQLLFQLKQLERRSLKKSGLQRIISYKPHIISLLWSEVKWKTLFNEGDPWQ